MSRPQVPGIETAGLGRPQPWMMEHPIQVGECIGCGICIGECPVVVMTLVAEPTQTALAPRQGPIERPVAGRGRPRALAPARQRDPRGPQARAPVAVGRPAPLADGRAATRPGRSGAR